MPGILDAARFNAFDRNAVAVFKTVDLASYRYQRAGGTSLYRYVTYNRWTGWGQSANDCARRLYFSNEFLAQDQPFREPDCFETLSVRDLKSVNSVLRAAPRAPLASVYAKGRATFFVHGGKVGEGVVYTISEMSESVMGSLAEMARGIELAGQEIAEHKDLDPGHVDISDPEPDLLDPAGKDVPSHH